MKLRTILIASNLLSISIIMVFLIISYLRMYLPTEVVILLTCITLLAGVVSVFSHMIVTHPLLKGVRQLSDKSKQVAEGQFDVKLKEEGPKELKELASRFNDMSTNLDEMFRKVRESEAFKQEMIANISHDLKTPIASIHSYVEALQDDIIQDEETKEAYLKTIKSETNRLSLLIQELLDLSQYEKKDIPYESETVHIDQLVLETLQEFELLMQERDIEPNVSIAEEIRPITGSPNQLKRVLSNLIDNAIRYSEQGGNMDINIEQNDVQTTFNIKDTGPGIEEEHHQDIFERFYRVEKSRNKYYGGSGLGLAICKEIVEHHQGHIGVESEPGKGTTIWFTIPFPNKEGEQA
ncbi:sensor histidine kinase [Pontibacillus yanchengensis]|uniref:histidine kinase n=1 Tax=Pontibacillus yanchengensis Y32 TaxID=1385514 RepID=A0A0A2TT21_9BACI|nr:HAMP domain-containing sensor histidine kinase [Pontibacillus yanchengensis]KGP72390.1 histidine kinase [Pontibacillus yanchengensis Y32]